MSTRSDRLIDDWVSWLELSNTPVQRTDEQVHERLQVHAGVVTHPQDWPTETGARIYVAHDDCGPAYVGQTNRLLLTRVRLHFGNQRTAQQRLKAGSWQFVVSAVFEGITPDGLDECERAAADWLLPRRHRIGRRHPRPP